MLQQNSRDGKTSYMSLFTLNNIIPWYFKETAYAWKNDFGMSGFCLLLLLHTYQNYRSSNTHFILQTTHFQLCSPYLTFVSSVTGCGIIRQASYYLPYSASHFMHLPFWNFRSPPDIIRPSLTFCLSIIIHIRQTVPHFLHVSHVLRNVPLRIQFF